MTQSRTVEVRPEIYDRIADRLDETEFDSVDEYVDFVLQELLLQLEGSSSGFEEQDEEVRDRLRELGYLE